MPREGERERELNCSRLFKIRGNHIGRMSSQDKKIRKTFSAECARKKERKEEGKEKQEKMTLMDARKLLEYTE